ncbi:Uncharacterised protein [Salmonella enterica subsp. diarizonae]|uniref:Uncharacterized protein n=1 Tax=Salmonella diarizonae TaxID=59204 RepID=A0A379TZ62_SALDZ|nr:Uncharacterised protein [Salmonella enterica subsp. diarizonae]
MLLNRLLHVLYLDTAFQRMQFGDLQRLKAHIQPGNGSAFARHALRQNTAAAADIEHLFTEQAAGTFGNVAQTQRVNTVQRLNSPSRSHQRDATASNLAFLHGQRYGVPALFRHS